MSYVLRADERVGPGLRRVSLGQLDHAQRSLRRAQDSETEALHEAVHDARKRFKKIRALLRLVRDEIGPDVYGRENAFYRDAGRRLGPVRDSYVLIVTLDDVLETYAREVEGGAFAATREQLVYAQRDLEQRAMQEGALAQLADWLEGGRAQLSTLPIERHKFEVLRPGLRRVYRRGRKGLWRAYADPTALRFHEWRKRVKYLWYQVRLLNPLWPGLFSAWAEELHLLSERLGAAHDVVQLQARIEDAPELCPDGAQREILLRLLARRRREWEGRARPLGERAYIESPGAFVRRMGGYWRVWQGEGG
jgi:CHAD domain-containing protein